MATKVTCSKLIINGANVNEATSAPLTVKSTARSVRVAYFFDPANITNDDVDQQTETDSRTLGDLANAEGAHTGGGQKFAPGFHKQQSRSFTWLSLGLARPSKVAQFRLGRMGSGTRIC